MRDDFFAKLDGFLAPMLWADVAWTAPTGRAQGEVHAVYTMALLNPQPAKPVAALEVAGAGGGDWGVASVFAVTADHTAPAGRLLFVAPNGSDSNEGGLDKPWATPEKAVADAKPGDTVFFRAGRYTLKGELKLSQVGKEGAWTTFSAYPGETPVFDAVNVLPAQDREKWDGELAAVKIDRSARFTRVRGLTVENCINFAIHGASEQMEIAHNTVFNTWHTGIWCSGVKVKAIGNTLVRVCYTKTLGEFTRKFPDLLNNKFTADLVERQKKSRLRHECLDCGSSGSDGIEAAYNEVSTGDKEGIDCKGGPRNVRIHRNFVHHITMTTGLYVDAWTKPMVGVEVDHNIVWATAVTGIAVASEGGSGLEDINVHHNVSIENGCSGLLLSACAKDGKKKNVRFDNNTVVGNGTNKTNPNAEGGMHIGSDNAEGMFVRNNIFANNRDYGIARNVAMTPADMNITIQNNLVQPAAEKGGRVFPDPTDKRQEPWIHEPGENAVTGDPRFVDPQNFNFRLKPGSPAIGAGVAAGGAKTDLGALPVAK